MQLILKPSLLNQYCLDAQRPSCAAGVKRSETKVRTSALLAVAIKRNALLQRSYLQYGYQYEQKVLLKIYYTALRSAYLTFFSCRGQFYFLYLLFYGII
jgi:hypothetical protein